MVAARQKSMRSILLVKPRTLQVPFLLNDGKKFVLTLREATISDTLWLQEEAERMGIGEKPSRPENLLIMTTAFVHQLEDDAARAGLMKELEATDEAGLTAALLNAPTGALERVGEAMQSLTPPEGGEASEGAKKRRKKRAAVWIIIALLFAGFLGFHSRSLVGSPCGTSSLSWRM